MGEASELGRLEELFHRASDLGDEGRAALLAELRGDDPRLAAMLEELLAAEREPDARLTGETDRRDGLWGELAGSLDLGPGDAVGPFRLLEKLGEGGMATVYRAVRETDAFRQEVAVKVLRPGLLTEDGLARFDRERRIVAALDHPNIARLVDGGVTPDGRPYFALELVDGRPIDVYCDEERLSVAERVELVISVGEALHYAHRNLVVHRDLKPSNVVVDGEGRVRLLDFGIAKELDLRGAGDLTRSGALPMTPVYSTPEQLTGRAVTTASDQYQLGLLLFELVTGRCHHLLDGTDSASIQRRAADLESPRPSRLIEGRTTGSATSSGMDPLAIAEARQASVRELARSVRGDLDTIVLKALEKEPDWRYPSVAGMVADLRRYLRGEPIAAQPPSGLYRARKWVGRHRALAALAASLALVLALAAAWGVWSERRDLRVREFSQRVERETEQMEQLLRTAALQPLHDTTRERRQVRERMARLESEAAADPALLGSAADYGVGRGHLALGEPEAASRRLLRAWEEGFRGAGIRYALGAALGELYEEALAEARALEDPRLAAERVERAVEELRDPALEHLRAAGAEIVSGARLGAALISFYEGDLDGALAQVRGVREDAPWDPAALALESRVLTRRAEGAVLAGDSARARADLREAEAVIREGLGVARSDAELYLRDCHRAYVHILVDAERGGTMEELVAAAEDACGAASRIRPDWVEPHLELGSVYLTAWDNRRWLGPTDDLHERFRETAERALALDPDNGRAHHRLGVALYEAAWREIVVGRDPRDTYREALRALRRAVELDPDYPFNYNALSLVTTGLARAELDLGGDPRELIAESRRYAEKAVALLPDWPNARSNLAASHAAACERAAQVGEDPLPACLESLAVLDEALALNPSSTRTEGQRARVLWHLVGTLSDQGRGDPEVTAELERTAARIVEERPFDASSLSAAAGGQLLAAWERFERDERPVPLEGPRRLLARAVEILPEHGNAAMLRLDLELLGLRLAVRQGDGVDGALRGVEAAATHLASLDHYYPQVERSLAERQRVLAALDLSRGRNPSRRLAEGLAAADLASRGNPIAWGASAERAALWILRAAATGDAADLALAERELAAVVGRNPPVEPRVRPLLQLAADLRAARVSAADAARRLLDYRGAFPGR